MHLDNGQRIPLDYEWKVKQDKKDSKEEQEKKEKEALMAQKKVVERIYDINGRPTGDVRMF